MKTLHSIERLGGMNALELLSVPFDERENALALMRARWYSAAIAGGLSHRSAVRWTRKTERLTRALVEIMQLRL